jgi:hypothetical protein
VLLDEGAATSGAPRKDVEMRITPVVVGTLSLLMAGFGLGLGTGTAQANPSIPHTWCPGQPMRTPTGPGANYVWDMTICHTWQYTRSGFGNVDVRVPESIDPVTSQPVGWTVIPGGNVWDGPNIPPGAAAECGYGLFGGPIVC